MTGSWNPDGEWMNGDVCVDGLILSEVTEQSVQLLSRPFLSVVGHLLPPSGSSRLVWSDYRSAAPSDSCTCGGLCSSTAWV